MFITFEGIDSSGKSTQCGLIREWLESQGHDILFIREPGGTDISEKIRNLLLDPVNDELDGVTELLLFSAARSQLVVEQIRPALDAGKVVVADRFYDSTTAYQGYGRGIDIATVLRLHELATHGTHPDLTFFLDISYEESVNRRNKNNLGHDRIEMADESFFNNIRKGYRELATTNKDRFFIIDGLLPVNSITEQMIDVLRQRLERTER